MKRTKLATLIFIFTITGNIYSQEIDTSKFIVWLNSADSLVKKGVDNNVAAWKNLLDTNIQALQSNMSYQPLYIDSIPELNNNGALYFDIDNLVLGDLFDIDTLKYVTILLKSYKSSAYSMFLSKGYTGEGSFTLARHKNVDNVRYYIDNTVQTTTTTIDTSWVILTVELNRDANQIVLYKNGLMDYSGSTTNDLKGNNSLNWTIGSDASSVSYTLKGYITDLIFMDTSSVATDRINTEQYLKNKYAPPVSLAGEINIAYGFADTLINAYKPWFTGFNWSSSSGSFSSNDSAITVSQSDTYYLTVNDIFNINSTDSIEITYPSINYPIISSDTTICLGDTLLWDTGLGTDYTYNWAPTQTSTTIYPITEAGSYSVEVFDSLGNSIISETINIAIDSFLVKNSLGESEQSICEGEAVTLVENSDDITKWKWSTGSEEEYINITNEGEYWVKVNNSIGCESSDTVNYSFSGLSPTVEFFADTVCFGDTTVFTNISSISLPDYIVNYNWNFGNDSSSNLQNPKHLYEEADTFVVSLTATSNTGCSNFYIDSVVVKARPLAGFEILYGDTHCVASEISFFDTSVFSFPILEYNWDFGDSGSSLEQNPKHNYSTNNTFVVQHSVTNSLGCIDSVSKEIMIEYSLPLSEPFFLNSPNDSSSIQDREVVFSWQVSNNTAYYCIQISLTEDFSSLVFDSTGIIENSIYLELPNFKSFYWKIIAFNVCGKFIESNVNVLNYYSLNEASNNVLWLNGTKTLIKKDINNRVSSWKNVLDTNIQAIQSNLIYMPLFIDSIPELNNNGALYFESDKLVFGNLFTIDTLKYVTVLLKSYQTSTYGMFLSKGYGGDGCFTLARQKNADNIRYYIDNTVQSSTTIIDTSWVILTVELNRGAAQINLYKNGLLDYSGGTTNDLKGTNELAWSIGCDAGSYSYAYKGYITDILFMDTTSTESDRINNEEYFRTKYSPPITLVEDILVDYGFADTTLSAHQYWFTNYKWASEGDSISADSAITISHPGTYHVTVTDIFGFTSTDSVKVTYPQPKNISDTTICRYDTVLWNPGIKGDYTYQWSNNETSPELAITEPGSYWLIMRDNKGYPWYSDTITVIVDEFPAEVSLGNDTTLCAGNRVYLQNGFAQAESYLWSTGAVSEFIELQTAGEYSVIVSNSFGCIGYDTVTFDINGIAPNPNFDYEQVCHGDLTQFTDQSSTTDGSIIEGWQWNFGDGNVSNTQNTEHLYGETGKYELELIVATSNNCSNIIKLLISIYSLPTASFVPNIACSNYPIQFLDYSISPDDTITQWQWLFPNAELSFEQNPIFTFTESVNTEVQLISTTKHSCSDTIKRLMEIKTGPKTDFSYSPACEGYPVYFTDASESNLNLPLIYEWTIDGNNFTQKNPSYLFNSLGEQPVLLKTTQSENKCYSTKLDTITVSLNPLAEFSYDIICVDNPTLFSDNSSSPNKDLVFWEYMIDSIGVVREPNPSIEFKSPGNYSVSYRVADNAGCRDTIFQTIEVNALPLPSFLVNPVKGSVPLYVDFQNETTNANTYFWTFGDGQSSQEKNPSHQYVDSGFYTINMIAYSDFGCVDSTLGTFKGIVPKVDLVVSNTKAKVVDGYLQVECILQNHGTLDYPEIELFYKANYGQVIKEVHDIPLLSGQTYRYKFSTQMQVKTNTSLSHVCVQAYPIGLNDEFPENNEDCMAFADAFTLLESYPNPADDEFVIEYIIPFKSEVIIKMYNLYGKSLGTLYDDVSEEGYNRHTINVSTYWPGVYIYQIEYEGSRKSFQIVVN